MNGSFKPIAFLLLLGYRRRLSLISSDGSMEGNRRKYGWENDFGSEKTKFAAETWLQNPQSSNLLFVLIKSITWA